MGTMERRQRFVVNGSIPEDTCTPKEVMTCIHVGLLCVQDHAMDRLTMSEVVSMLTNENMHLPEPKQPAFFIESVGACL
ncbi:putative non-specific serine/threonine protein kinase [Helianthus annuus]|nr:putative non-specific serine/threonine protein kinase [Helianthus annuus]